MAKAFESDKELLSGVERSNSIAVEEDPRIAELEATVSELNGQVEAERAARVEAEEEGALWARLRGPKPALAPSSLTCRVLA